MSKSFKLSVRQTVEAYNFNDAFGKLKTFGKLKPNGLVTAFGTIGSNGLLWITKFVDDTNGMLAGDLNEARTQFEGVEERKEELREVELKLAIDYFDYLKMVIDYNNAGGLVELGLAKTSIYKRKHGIADHSVLGANIPNWLEKTSIETALREAVNNAPKDKLWAIYDESSRIINEIERYAATVEGVDLK